MAESANDIGMLVKDVSTLLKYLVLLGKKGMTARLPLGPTGEEVDVYAEENGSIWEKTGDMELRHDPRLDTLYAVIRYMKRTPSDIAGRSLWDVAKFDVSAQATVHSQFKDRGYVSIPGLPGVPVSLCKKYGIPETVVDDYLDAVELAVSSVSEAEPYGMALNAIAFSAASAPYEPARDDIQKDWNGVPLSDRQRALLQEVRHTESEAIAVLMTDESVLPKWAHGEIGPNGTMKALYDKVMKIARDAEDARAGMKP